MEDEDTDMTVREPDHVERYREHYSESSFWDKVKDVAKKAGVKVIYAALCLYYMLQDPSVPLKDKALIAGALGYFILPVDLLPDPLPGGYTDDLAALLAAYKAVMAHMTPEVREKARGKLSEWFGDQASANLDLD